MKLHPEKNPANREITEKKSEVTRAYKILPGAKKELTVTFCRSRLM